MAGERKYKLEYKDGKEEVKKSVSAKSHADAIREVFGKVGAISLEPVEVVAFYFTAELEGGKTLKGEVKLARKSSSEGPDDP